MNRRAARQFARLPLLAILLACACGATPAQAQLIQQYFPTDIPGYQPDFSASVINRMYLQGQADGVRLGDFVIRPELSEAAGYNSNTLAAPNSGSGEIESKAGIQANSDWSRDALGVAINVDDHRYLEKPNASYTDWTASAGGSLDLGDDTATLAYSRLNQHLAATDLGVAGVVTPVPYSVDDARLSYLKLFGRFSITPSFEFQNFAFGQAGGSNDLSYRALSHHTEGGALTGRFESAPGDAVVVILRATGAQFHADPGNDYLDLAGFAGLDFQGDRVIEYRVLAGLESRRFPNGHFPDTEKTANTPTFELDAIWTPTELDTITASGTHRLDDPSSPFARDQDILDGRFELDHQLLSDLFLTASAEAARGISQSGLADVGSIRQTQINLGLGAVWYINRHVSGKVSYGYEDSAAAGGSATTTAAAAGYPSFDSHIILVGVSLFE